MKICDKELLARLRALGSKARGQASPVLPDLDRRGRGGGGLLGLPEQELTPACARRFAT